MISLTDFAPIAALDLDPIKVKLMRHDDGKGWSRQQADAVEFEYRRFLYLMKTFPHEPTAPLVDVDTFWHYHILDTMKYAADCEQVFGYFLHHFPYVGLRGKEDAQALVRMGERMREVYEETFGDSYLRPLADASPKLRSADRSKVDAQPAHRSRVDAQSAYCSRIDTQPAYCSKLAPAQSAYCSRIDARPAYCSKLAPAQSAYCSRIDAQPAYCSRVDDGASADRLAAAAPMPEHGARFYADRPALATI